MKAAKKPKARTPVRVGSRIAKKQPAPAGWPRMARGKAAPTRPRKVDVVALLSARAAGAPAAPAGPVSAQRLLQMLETRLQERAREFATTKSRFEDVAKALQGLSAPSAERGSKGGPRRFRPSATEARAYQQQLGELGTELRLLTARRAELAWVRLMLGGSAPARRPAR